MHSFISFRRLFNLIAALAAAPLARAEHGDVWLHRDAVGNTLAVGVVDEAGVTFTPGQRIFESILVSDALPFSSFDFSAEEPGFRSAAGDLPSSEPITLTLDSLRVWNGATFDPAVGVAFAFDLSGGFATDAAGAFHEHPLFGLTDLTLDPLPLPDGVYVASFRASMASLGDSLPIDYVMLKDELITNESDAELLAELIEDYENGGPDPVFGGKNFAFFEGAVSTLEAAVPEPSGAILIALAGVALTRRRWRGMAVAASAALVVACIAPAHIVASDVLVQSVAGKLTTGYSDVDNGGAFTLGARVFPSTFPMSFARDDPGFNSIGAGGSIPRGADALPGGKNLQWDFLPMTVNSPAGPLKSNLLYWNAVGATLDDVAFGPPPAATYSLALFGKNSASAAANGSDQLIPGATIETTAADGFIHRHRFFFLDNDANPENATVAAAGIYLVAMQLRMTGLQTSDPLYIAFSTPGVPLAQLNALAIPWIESHIDELIPPQIPGDYNADGAVEGADVLAWQRQLGGIVQYPGSGADGDPNGMIDAADLAVWRSRLPVAASTSFAVPEPSAGVATTIAVMILVAKR